MTTKRSARSEVTPDGQMEEARLQKVLGYQLAQASIVTNAIFFEQVGTPFELRPVEYTVLTLIAENPGGSLARLARALSVTPPNITMMVERLEGKGLVARRPSEEDRRAMSCTSLPRERIWCAEPRRRSCRAKAKPCRSRPAKRRS